MLTLSKTAVERRRNRLKKRTSRGGLFCVVAVGLFVLFGETVGVSIGKNAANAADSEPNPGKRWILTFAETALTADGFPSNESIANQFRSNRSSGDADGDSLKSSRDAEKAKNSGDVLVDANDDDWGEFLRRNGIELVQVDQIVEIDERRIETADFRGDGSDPKTLKIDRNSVFAVLFCPPISLESRREFGRRLIQAGEKNDVVSLTNGDEISGNVVRLRRRILTVQYLGETIDVPISRVRAVRFARRQIR